jgi:lipopolysaccharide export system permease protein
MSIIYKYLSREILKNFGVILVAVICIYLAVDFFEKIDDFMEAGLPFSRAATFFFYSTPFIVAQIMPVGLFLAILVVFGLMSKNNEIIVLKSSGISIYALLWPVLSLGLMFTILLFFLTEVIVPVSASKANEIWLREVRDGRYHAGKKCLDQGKPGHHPYSVL